MFEQLTSGARRVVDLAQAAARTLRHGYIGTEHLLLGLLGEEGGIAAQALRGAGVTAQAVRADVQRLVADSLLTGPDADALRAIGIDVEQVRARVEESFGAGALERARFGGCRRACRAATSRSHGGARRRWELSLPTTSAARCWPLWAGPPEAVDPRCGRLSSRQWSRA